MDNPQVNSQFSILNFEFSSVDLFRGRYGVDPGANSVACTKPRRTY